MAGLTLITARGQGAYYYEDISALLRRPTAEADRWNAPGETPGFKNVREVAEVVSVGLSIGDEPIAWGDCVGVSYGGLAGRAPVVRADALERELRQSIAPRLATVSFSNFRAAEDWLAEQKLSAPLAYGLSQALLAHFAGKQTATEKLCAEYALPLPNASVPLHGSSGNDRYGNADKMIANRLEVLPHTQVEDLPTQFGPEGEVLLDYAVWLVRRVAELASPPYRPAFYFDVHGAWGRAFSAAPDKGLRFLERLAEICRGHALTVESPIVESSLDAQVEALHGLRRRLKTNGIPVSIAVDEWGNSAAAIRRFLEAEAVDEVHIKMPTLGSLHESIESMRLCREFGKKSLLGGSCIETDLSARLSAHLALAFRPDALLVKPGMGLNEGISLMRNEMSRTLSTIAHRRGEKP